MASLLQKLKAYFEEHSFEEIQKAWEETASYDEIDSPSVEEFITTSKELMEIDNQQRNFPKESFINNFKNPNFGSDFFYLIMHHTIKKAL